MSESKSVFKDRIVELRRKGHSLKSIVKIVGCAKSTAGLYSRDIEIADRSMIDRSIRDNAKNASRRAEEKWNNAVEAVINDAKKEWKVVKNDPELMGFLGLYWGEGTKIARGHRTSQVGIANSDPSVIIKCKRCFDRLSSNNRYDCNIIIYDDLDPEEMRTFWENKIGVEVKRIEVRKNHKLRRCTHGTCYLRFSNYKLSHRILTWIECWKNEPVEGIEPTTV